MSTSGTIVLPARYDGVDLDADESGEPRMRIRCISGFLETWEPRGGDRVVPTAHGQRAKNRKRHRLAIELWGPVMGVGATEVLAQQDLVDAILELRTLFATERTPALLEVRAPSGQWHSITARPLPYMLGDDSVPGYREVSIPLEAVGDDWTPEAS